MKNTGINANKSKLSLQTTITLLVCAVVIISLFVTEILIVGKISKDTKTSQEAKATDISRIVSRSPQIIEALLHQRNESAIQQFTTDIQKATGVEFIVVMDMKGIRKSHPNKDLIGKRFVGGDEGPVLHGKEHISIAKGTLGTSLRSFTPIYDDNKNQIGAAAVGILLDQVNNNVSQSRKVIYLGVAFGIFAGIIGALLLARKIKSILCGLEPSEIAKLLEERSAMLQSTKEGMIAVDPSGCITLVNKEGRRLLELAGKTGDPIGKKIQDFMPGSGLAAVLESGVEQLEQEQDLNGVALLINQVPILVKGNVVGAIATFRDKTELKQLAEQLSGVKLYAEALRSQSHEFMNKLHVISGLISMENYSSVSKYINKAVNDHQTEARFIQKCIKDSVLAGFLLGKLSYARENGAELTVDGDGEIPAALNQDTIHELVTILGNLINNALETVKEAPVKRIAIRFDYYEQRLVFEVHDNGTGIDGELTEKMFTKGYSTKGEGRGLGLFLVKKSIDKLCGAIEIGKSQLGGTAFIVEIPYIERENPRNLTKPVCEQEEKNWNI